VLDSKPKNHNVQLDAPTESLYPWLTQDSDDSDAEDDRNAPIYGYGVDTANVDNNGEPFPNNNSVLEEFIDMESMW